MSSLKVKIANFFAKQSCSAWQSNRVVRKVCRNVYRFIMETGPSLRTYDNVNDEFRAKSYPYEDAEFANWPESDGDFYTLITDSDNFVIRRSTSYIAWLMKKHCGGWPKPPIPGERKPGEHNFDAKHWDEVLEFNGWQKVSKEDWPTWQNMNDDDHFIGIIADEGEFGQLVWFVGASVEEDFKTPIEWRVWTYENFKKVDRMIPATEETGVVWYREPKKGRYSK